jgi:hypothetical protein
LRPVRDSDCPGDDDDVNHEHHVDHNGGTDNDDHVDHEHYHKHDIDHNVNDVNDIDHDLRLFHHGRGGCLRVRRPC